MKFIIDMCLSPDWVGYLQNNAHAAKHWREIGIGTEPDSVIFSWAKEQDHIIFTHDLDFSVILAQSHSTKPSVIQLRSKELMPKTIGKLILEAIESSREALEEGAVVTVDPISFRVRILPL